MSAADAGSTGSAGSTAQAGSTGQPDRAGDVAEALDRLAHAVAAGRPVLVALDFDGVLAPLQDDPAASRATPEAAAALERLAAVRGVTLALVSGRGLADLAGVAGAPAGTVLVGSHGAERGTATPEGLERAPLDLDADAAALHDRLAAELEAAVAGTSARLEVKPTTVVVHTRTAAPDDAARLTAIALELGARTGADTMHGKDVVELSVLDVTKGHALADLRTAAGAGPGDLLYAGDDVTDERAFATLDPADVTVRVGPGETAARLRVPDPDAVGALLHGLADRLDQAPSPDGPGPEAGAPAQPGVAG